MKRWRACLLAGVGLAATASGGFGDTFAYLSESDPASGFVWAILNAGLRDYFENFHFEMTLLAEFQRRNYLTLEEHAAKPPDTPGLTLVLSREEGAGGNGFGVVGLPFDLHPPFRWEVSAGKIRPGTTGPGTGFFCTELDERDSSPLQYHTLCAQPSGEGFQVWVSRPGENLIGLTWMGPAAALDLAVEHDGGTITFLARPRGEGEYTLVAALDHAPPVPLVPSFGASQIPAGAVVDFDDFRIASNGPLPEDAPPERVLARTVQDAAGPLTDAFHAMEGLPWGDPVAEKLEEAAALLAAAAEEVREASPGMANPKAGKKAASDTLKASRAAASVARSLRKGKSGLALARKTHKALMGTWRALYYVDPHFMP